MINEIGLERGMDDKQQNRTRDDTIERKGKGKMRRS